MQKEHSGLIGRAYFQGGVDWEAQQSAYMAVNFSIFSEVKTEHQWKP